MCCLSEMRYLGSWCITYPVKDVPRMLDSEIAHIRRLLLAYVSSIHFCCASVSDSKFFGLTTVKSCFGLLAMFGALGSSSPFLFLF